MNGRLIVIEGIDGTGKTTLAGALAEALVASGLVVTRSFEPTQGPQGRRLRELARAGRDRLPLEEEIELFLADRAAHQREVIMPALARGEYVLLDRYYFSSMAYQGARGGDVADIEARNRAVARPPDLLLLLELPVETALARIHASRGSGPDLFEGSDYLENVARIFAAMDYPYLKRLDATLPAPALLDRALQHARELVAS